MAYLTNWGDDPSFLLDSRLRRSFGLISAAPLDSCMHAKVSWAPCRCLRPTLHQVSGSLQLSSHIQDLNIDAEKLKIYTFAGLGVLLKPLVARE